jgi:hypothetical protein
MENWQGKIVYKEKKNETLTSENTMNPEWNSENLWCLRTPLLQENTKTIPQKYV